MHKSTRRGFTLIEMIVVMAAIAILSVLGISALISINDNNITDKAAEEIITAVREAQNKALSVASHPDGTSNPPIAWGYSCDDTTWQCKTFFVDSTYKTDDTYAQKFDYSGLNMALLGSAKRYFFYTTPFGKFYSTSSVPPDGLGTGRWALNPDRPRDAIPAVATQAETRITINKRGSTATVVITANGDAYVE